MRTKEKSGEERSNGGARMLQDVVLVCISQEVSTVVFEDSVEPSSVVNAGAPAAGVRLVQVTGNAGSQRSTGGGVVSQEEKCRKDV